MTISTAAAPALTTAADFTPEQLELRSARGASWTRC